MRQLRYLKAATEALEQEMENDELPGLYSKIKEIILDIENLKIEKFKNEKRDERLKENKEELINLLKQELSKMNVELG